MKNEQIDLRKKYILRFLVVILLLIFYGLIAIYSASAVFACEQFGSAHYYLIRHGLALLLGSLGALCCAFFPLNRYKSKLFFSLIIAIILTILTLVPGVGSACHGARRWLWGSSFQPGEFLKVALFLYCSSFIEKRYYELNNFSKSIAPLFLVTLICSLIFLCQPDFGSAVLTTITVLALCLVAGIHNKTIFLTMGFSLPVGFLLIIFKPYRLQRILTYLDPWQDPQGKGYQIIQSLVALGSGGLWGEGLSYSKQKFFYLPMQHTDFIFSIIGEELGLFGSTAVVILYLLFMYYGFKLIRLARTVFTQALIFCTVFYLSLEAMLNCMVVTGLVPTKGLALPFISYGSSVLWRSLALIGFSLGSFFYEKDTSSIRLILEQKIIE